ncbi:DNA polymerase I [Janibacter sp. HTCC2649]|nr:DNA polymerase I [Janibacter sp. HTCC2649]
MVDLDTHAARRTERAVRIARITNIAIGALTLVVSFVASLWRYHGEHSISPSMILTSAIFGFMAITLVITLRRGMTSGITPGNAGMVWLVLLLLTTAATWQLIPSPNRPFIGVFLALVAGVAIGAAVVPGMELGSGDDGTGIRGGRGPWGGGGG